MLNIIFIATSLPRVWAIRPTTLKMENLPPILVAQLPYDTTTESVETNKHKSGLYM